MDEVKINELVVRAMAGDAVAFDELCKEKARNILYLCVKVMGNVPDGEDAAQEVLITLQKNITKLRSPEAFSSWLYQVAVRQCRKMRARQQSQSTLPIEDELAVLREEREEFLPQNSVDQLSRREVLMNAINTLPDDCKICVILFYYESMKYKEIGQALGIKTSDVGSLLAKSKKLIRQQLDRVAKDKNATISTFAFTPVMLLAALAQDAGAVVTGGMVQELVIGTAGALAAGAGATTHAAAKGGAFAGKALAGKVVLGVAGAAVLAGGIYFAAPTLPAPAVVPASVAAPASSAPVVSQPPQEAPIHTLQDMLGEERAAEFLGYVEAGADAATVEQMLLANNLQRDISGTDSQTDETYTLYYLYKQDKLLMAIAKTDAAGQTQLAYRFTNRTEALLEHVQIYFVFDEWKAEN